MLNANSTNMIVIIKLMQLSRKRTLWSCHTHSFWTGCKDPVCQLLVVFDSLLRAHQQLPSSATLPLSKWFPHLQSRQFRCFQANFHYQIASSCEAVWTNMGEVYPFLLSVQEQGQSNSVWGPFLNIPGEKSQAFSWEYMCGSHHTSVILSWQTEIEMTLMLPPVWNMALLHLQVSLVLYVIPTQVSPGLEEAWRILCLFKGEHLQRPWKWARIYSPPVGWSHPFHSEYPHYDWVDHSGRVHQKIKCEEGDPS